MTRPEPTSDITPDTPSGVIAVQVPAAIPVFRRLWIDFCSSQPIPLVDAVTRAGANLDEVLGEILALPRQKRTVSGAPYRARGRFKSYY